MKGSPFTQLCRQAAVLQHPARADLHTHSTFSDGTHTPQALVERALAAKLSAIAVTDHDTTAGVEPTRAAAESRIEVIAGVEITSEFRGHEIHLLGYFIDLDDEPLQRALADVRQGRRERLIEMARRLQARGVSVVEEIEAMPAEVSLGRRHLASLLVAQGHTRSLHDAFRRWLCVPELASIPKVRLPASKALALIREAGGVSSWAHPPETTDVAAILELRDLGLRAVECAYPWTKPSHGKRLRAIAEQLGMAISGGSDSHDASRAVGVRGVTGTQLQALRGMARQTVCSKKAFGPLAQG